MELQKYLAACHFKKTHPGKCFESFMKINCCPSCKSPKIQHVCQDWRGDFKGVAYTVPALEFYECPVCGERVFDREAVRKIESHSPAFNKPPRLRRGFYSTSPDPSPPARTHSGESTSRTRRESGPLSSRNTFPRRDAIRRAAAPSAPAPQIRPPRRPRSIR